MLHAKQNKNQVIPSFKNNHDNHRNKNFKK